MLYVGIPIRTGHCVRYIVILKHAFAINSPNFNEAAFSLNIFVKSFHINCNGLNQTQKQIYVLKWMLHHHLEWNVFVQNNIFIWNSNFINFSVYVFRGKLVFKFLKAEFVFKTVVKDENRNISSIFVLNKSCRRWNFCNCKIPHQSELL